MNYKEEILSILKTIKRKGMRNLIKFLEEETFFIDPASCAEHNSYEGGLAEHSYHVYKLLERYSEKEDCFSNCEDSIKIISLLHDISLVGSFQKSYKNTPLKGKDGKNRKDERNKLIFMEKEIYAPYHTSLPYSHPHLSSIILKRYIPLTKLEDLAIVWHSIYPHVLDTELTKRAQATHKIILYTYFADKEAKLYHRIRKK